MENIAFADVRRSVKESMSSIFTREDVLRIVDKLDSAPRMSIRPIQDAIQNVLDACDNIQRIDTSDVEDIELSISRMEISVDSLSIVGLDSALSDLQDACQSLSKMLSLSELCLLSTNSHAAPSP